MSSFIPKVFKDIENTDVYKAALDKWGMASQVLMLVEETGEMLAKLSQYNRGRITLEELVEEMVDSMMMLDEVFYLLDVSDEMRERVLKKKMGLFRDRLTGDEKQKMSPSRLKELGVSDQDTP